MSSANWKSIPVSQCLDFCSFKTGSTNVLIATDVLEEGIDVQECNLVIMFDPVKTFRSYIQSKGRARVKNGEYIILNDAETNVDSQIDRFKNIDILLDQVNAYDEFSTFFLVIFVSTRLFLELFYRSTMRMTLHLMKTVNRRRTIWTNM